ncbi:MAG: prolipoprotein diacylglyceryl transferase family protein [Candidatus Sedimenticola endophacoides]
MWQENHTLLRSLHLLTPLAITHLLFVYYYHQMNLPNTIALAATITIGHILLTNDPAKSTNTEQKNPKLIFAFILIYALLAVTEAIRLWIQGINAYGVFIIAILLVLLSVCKKTKLVYDFDHLIIPLTFLIVCSFLATFIFPEISGTAHRSRIIQTFNEVDTDAFSRQKGILWSPQALSFISAINILLLLYHNSKLPQTIIRIALYTSLITLLLSETRTSILSLLLSIFTLYVTIHVQRKREISRTPDSNNNTDEKVVASALILALLATLIAHIFFNTSHLDITSGRIQLWTNNTTIPGAHNHNIFIDVAKGFYPNPLSGILLLTLPFLAYIFYRAQLHLCFCILIFILIGSNFDIIWRVDRGDFTTGLLLIIMFNTSILTNQKELG